MASYKSYGANTIGDDVYEKLKEEILNLTIKPGQVLTEQEICEKYGISRTPSRDVLQRLRNDDLVVAIPYKANYVALLNLDTIQQMIYMRMAIETKVIKDAIAIMDDRFVKALDENLARQEALLKTDFQPEEFFEIDSELHKTWFEATHKCAVWEQIQKAQVHYTRFRMLDIVVVKNFTAIYQEHVKLVDMIKEKRVEEIEGYMTRHLQGGAIRLGEKIYNEYADFFVKQEKYRT
ncbi:GntR family transcriptional regulator [Anaerotalea alkaliphila]|uniref:GntR family transcriptional regulator n=1 Tax=Anaerotalea alkaliphila TaxID=2662126 RepID=A0A7X5HXA4_9FIRM|nr:GntR family transcriptional regulator [Anaerotalea alkaliphila]NDL68368.1 GntR family transcriptional regulator [Anaerotalea alkaliphila]